MPLLKGNSPVRGNVPKGQKGARFWKKRGTACGGEVSCPQPTQPTNTPNKKKSLHLKTLLLFYSQLQKNDEEL